MALSTILANKNSWNLPGRLRRLRVGTVPSCLVGTIPSSCSGSWGGHGSYIAPKEASMVPEEGWSRRKEDAQVPALLLISWRRLGLTASTLFKYFTKLSSCAQVTRVIFPMSGSWPFPRLTHSIRVLQRHKMVTYHKELTWMTGEAEKPHSLPPATWRPQELMVCF